MRERLRNYEMLFIISPLRSSEDEVATVINRLQQTITEQGGEVTTINQSSPWGRRRFAYPIRAYAGGEASRRTFTEGYYIFMNFTLSSVKVTELEYVIKYTDAILRHMITLVETRRMKKWRDDDEEQMEGDEDNSNTEDDL